MSDRRVTDEARDLVSTAAQMIATSIELDRTVSMLLWKASREEGASYDDIRQMLEFQGFGFSREAVQTAVRKHEDENAIRHELELKLQSFIDERELRSFLDEGETA